MTSTLVPPAVLDPTRVPIGLDSTGSWVDLRFTEIENPHILIIGGSQCGKTTLQILIAAVAASRGNIVVIIDPKLRFSRAFRHPKTRKALPNVLVYRDADEYIAAREQQGILELVIAEMQHRYRSDEQANVNILGDQGRFPTILVVVDELGTALDFADKEWPDRKPDDYKGKTPIRELIHTLTRMGAEARAIGCFANQTAAEQEMPAGTRTRQLCGQRVFLGPVREGPQWRMLAGEGTPPPDIPDGQKGAGAVIFSDRKPIRLQAGFLDWKNHPEHVYNLAAQGLPILRESGYLDEHDRLILAGVVVPVPGTMASHVAGSRVDLLGDVTYTQTSVDDTEEAAETTPPATPAKGPATPAAPPEPPTPPADERMVIGNEAAAEFCGLSVANFRRIKTLHSIDGEIRNYKGNKPGWQEADLKVWAMRHAENRGRRTNNTNEKEETA